MMEARCSDVACVNPNGVVQRSRYDVTIVGEVVTGLECPWMTSPAPVNGVVVESECHCKRCSSPVDKFQTDPDPEKKIS